MLKKQLAVCTEWPKQVGHQETALCLMLSHRMQEDAAPLLTVTRQIHLDLFWLEIVLWAKKDLENTKQ